MSKPSVSSNSQKLVLLVHGIRTRALWQNRIAPQLASKEIIVQAVGYSYFNVFEFLCPVFTRKRAIRKIKWRIQKAIHDNPDRDLVIIAHSFGTYCISKILEGSPEVEPKEVILCGSVVKDEFRWDRLRQQPRVVNDCGSKDIWPCLARATTWGYGSTGSFGFKTPGISDRYHPIAHGGFFKDGFAKKYWKPLVKQGNLVHPIYDDELPEPPLWISLIALRLLWLPWLGWIFLIIVTIFLSFHPAETPDDERKTALIGIFPSDSFGPLCHKGFARGALLDDRVQGLVFNTLTISEMKSGRIRLLEDNLREAFEEYNVIGVIGPPISETVFPVASFISEINPDVPVILTSAISENDPTWPILKKKMPLFRVGSSIGRRAQELQGLLKELVRQSKRIVFLVEHHESHAPRAFGLRFFDEMEHQMSYFSHIDSEEYQRVTFPSRGLGEKLGMLEKYFSDPDTVVFFMGLEDKMRWVGVKFYLSNKDENPSSSILIGWMNAHMLDELFRGGVYRSELILDINDFSPPSAPSDLFDIFDPEMELSTRDAMIYYDSSQVVLSAFRSIFSENSSSFNRERFNVGLSRMDQVIKDTNFQGLGGEIRFNSLGQNTARSLAFLRFNHAKSEWEILNNFKKIFD